MNLFEPLAFAHGPQLRNRFVLAPLTNSQSHNDGTLSDAEIAWLEMRAQGGFGLVMTAGANVQFCGRGFPGQLGVYDDKHIPGLTRCAAAIKKHGAVSSVQLYHAGLRAPVELTGEAPRAPYSDEATGGRALTMMEIEQLVEDFILAALRCEEAGFDGIELHGAHTYILCTFLDQKNQRADRYGGSLDNRSRIFFEIIEGIRERARPEFQIGVRLSGEMFDLATAEMQIVAQKLMASGHVDYIDMSLWDCFKEPNEEAFKGKPLLDCFTSLPRGPAKLGVAGKLTEASTAQACLDHHADFVLIGRGAILHHDFPMRAQDASFESIERPVTASYLTTQGVSPPFAKYLESFRGFVSG